MVETYFIILIFLFLSALFSGTEIAYISASKLWIELKRKKGAIRGRILAYFYDKPGDFLSVLLIGNNIALVIFTYLVTKQLEPVFEAQFGANEPMILLCTTFIITIVILIFGEFLPKTLFRLYANELIHGLAIPLRILQFLLYIPAWLMTKITGFLLRVIFKTPIENDESVITRLDLENFIKTTSNGETEEGINAELFGKALHLENVKVKQCMIPRTEIVHIDVSASIENLLDSFQESKLSRLLVIDEDIDEVLGYVHHQQLLEEPKKIKSIVLDVSIVPEAMRVRDLLNKFIQERINIACVVDEYGGTAGLITLEDILEEIFGEIEDEHDQEDYIEKVISDEEYVLSGRLEIDYLNEKYEQLDFPQGEYHTLSGYIVMTTEKIPKQGDEVSLNNYKFILEMVSDTKIETIRVIKLSNDNEAVAE